MRIISPVSHFAEKKRPWIQTLTVCMVTGKFALQNGMYPCKYFACELGGKQDGM
jgi:hypothetical protein